MSKIQNNKIYHLCNTKDGSSGSLIILLDNFKLIGIHLGYNKSFGFNKGILLKNALIGLNKTNNNLIDKNNKNTKINPNKYENLNKNINSNINKNENK